MPNRTEIVDKRVMLRQAVRFNSARTGFFSNRRRATFVL